MTDLQRRYDPERMEMNMDQRSETNELLYRGILPVAMSGSIVRYHVWDDGTMLPVLVGFDDPDPDDTGDGDEDDDTDDGDEDEEDGDDDDDDEDPDKIKDPKRREASQQAARYRVQRNEARTQRDEARAEVSDLKKKLKDAETKGGSDETLKARVAELEREVSEKDGKLSELESKARTAVTERQVRDVAGGMKIKEDIDNVMFLLERAGVKPDEDGQIDNLRQQLRKLVKAKKLSVRTDDDEDDDETDDDTARTSGRSSGRTMNRKRKSKGDLDRASLEKRFPALQR